ncbi:hypothetical protein, partial [Mesorhizobium sp.]|uniref:hypothetical protein n=1 Tax=Mesorhizobium sp. TaxID=1871066 RepID=UPI000FE64D0A
MTLMDRAQSGRQSLASSRHEHWGYRGYKWCMRKPPADHPPLPEVYKRERERAQQEVLDRIRIAAEARMLGQIQATGRRQRPNDREVRERMKAIAQERRR